MSLWGPLAHPFKGGLIVAVLKTTNSFKTSAGKQAGISTVRRTEKEVGERNKREERGTGRIAKVKSSELRGPVSLGPPRQMPNGSVVIAHEDL